MAPNPLLSARIPPDLNSRLEARSRETGKDKTQLVIEALRSYLSTAAEPSTEQKVARLEERVAALEATVAELVQHREMIASDQAPLPPTQETSRDQHVVPPMRQSELAKRLGLKNHASLTPKKLQSDFLEWSRERDPDGISWRYDSQSQLFYPVK